MSVFDKAISKENLVSKPDYIGLREHSLKIKDIKYAKIGKSNYFFADNTYLETKERYYQNIKKIREVFLSNTSKSVFIFYKDGRIHSTNHPAVKIYYYSDKKWINHYFVNGAHLTEEEWEMNPSVIRKNRRNILERIKK